MIDDGEREERARHIRLYHIVAIFLNREWRRGSENYYYSNVRGGGKLRSNFPTERE
jgi:hypothetical protein